METDTLNTLVSAGIWRAEQLEMRGIRGADAWKEVASLEEELAKALLASTPEGRIARRGAVRAALKAGEYLRAHALAENYLADEAAPESFRMSLLEILNEDAEAIAKDFRFAAARLSEAIELARRYREGGPFYLAAA